MGRTLRTAALQMDAQPAPTAERLRRAADLIAEAASSGAQLVVLPELFNTGYQYSAENYQLAEPTDGPTLIWLRAQARQHAVHLAGSFLLREDGEITNTAFLVAPDGQAWRYDKQYPWLHERAYFRAGTPPAVAHTALGAIGMLICWDAAHPDLWQAYAGQVDALVIMSCPPKMSAPDLVFPDGQRVPQRELGGLFRHIYTEEEYFPGVDMDAYAGWLGVPVIASTGAGTVKLKLPRPYLAMPFFSLLRPDLWGKCRQFKHMFLEAGFDKQTKVIDPQGIVLDRVTSAGDGFALAEITLADTKPQPTGPRPKMRTARLAYFLADVLPRLVYADFYNRHKHQH